MGIAMHSNTNSINRPLACPICGFEACAHLGTYSGVLMEPGFAEWLQACCELVPSKSESIADLTASLNAYFEPRRFYPVTSCRLAQVLKKMGFQRIRGNRGRRLVAGILIK